MRRHWWVTGGVVVLAVAGGLGWAVANGKLTGGDTAADAAKAPGGAASAPALEFRPTEVVQPVLAALPRTVQLSGPLVAPGTAVVRAKTAGILLQLDVAEGQRVRAGQPLGRIDVAELNTRIAERQANVESARASLVQAERTHASNERLAAQSFISPIALDNSRAQVDTARAALAAAQATLDTSRVGLREATPLAPIGGIVAKRHVVPGEKVSMEQALVTVVDLRTLELAGMVGTHEVGSLAPGMPVQVAVEGVAQAVDGRISRIAPAAEAGTRSIGVTVELANPGERLRAGQFALATVQLPDDRQRLVLPVTAIGSNAGQSHVWAIENGLLARRAVTTGREDAARGRVEVITGVTADTQVLVARFDNLREGAKALVTANAATRQASAASAPTLR
jgi:RND family efflux transporter MFP subunit